MNTYTSLVCLGAQSHRTPCQETRYSSVGPFTLARSADVVPFSTSVWIMAPICSTARFASSCSPTGTVRGPAGPGEGQAPSSRPAPSRFPRDFARQGLCSKREEDALLESHHSNLRRDLAGSA